MATKNAALRGNFSNVKEPVSVMSYGATGNGTTDDTNAIIETIAAAEADGSRAIHFPAGTFRVTAAGLNTNEAAITVPSNFVITGEGAKSIIKWEGDTWGGSETHPGDPYYYCFFSPFGYTNIRYENLSFVGMNNPFVFSKNAQSSCIYAITGSDLVVKGCTFDDLHGFSIHEDGNSDRTHVFDCVTRNCANGINVNGNWTILSNNRMYNSEGFECAGRSVLIQNNTMKNALVCAISCGGNTVPNFEAPGSQVIGNTIDGCDGIGILGNNAFIYGVISNNTLRNCDGGGIYLTHDIGSHLVKDNVISNNTVTDCCKAGNPNVSGIYIAGEGGNLITGNRVVDTGTGTYVLQYGIALLSNNNTVQNNYLDGTNHDLLINTGVTGNKIGENFFVNNKVQWLAALNTQEVRRTYGGAAGEYVDFSQIYNSLYPWWIRYADGKMEWGANNWPLDTNLYRSAANQLKTDDEFIAVGGIQSGSVINTNGTGASDVVVKVGTNVADGSVNSTARLFSVRTGISGSEVEYLTVSKNGVYFNGYTNSTISCNGSWIDFGILPPRSPSYWTSTNTTTAFYASGNGALGAPNTVRLWSENASGGSDIAVKIGCYTADGSVNGGTKLASFRTGLGGSEVESLYILKNGTIVGSDANAVLRLNNSFGAKLEYSTTGFYLNSVAGYFLSPGPLVVESSAADAADKTVLYANCQTAWTNTSSNLLYLQNNEVDRVRVNPLGMFRIYGTDSTASPGAATIDKPIGKSAIASGSSSVVITNSLVASGSHVIITPHARDTTCKELIVTTGAGSFTVSGSGNAAADLPFSWEVKGLL